LLELAEQKPFLQDPRGTDSDWGCATDGEIIDGSVDGELRNVASWKKSWSYHIGIRRHRDRAVWAIQQCRIELAMENGVFHRWKEDFIHQSLR